MNLSECINAFNNCVVISTPDLLKAYSEMQEIIDVLAGKGVMFETTRSYLCTEQYSITLVLRSRGENI